MVILQTQVNRSELRIHTQVSTECVPTRRTAKCQIDSIEPVNTERILGRITGALALDGVMRSKAMVDYDRPSTHE